MRHQIVTTFALVLVALFTFGCGSPPEPTTETGTVSLEEVIYEYRIIENPEKELPTMLELTTPRINNNPISLFRGFGDEEGWQVVVLCSPYDTYFYESPCSVARRQGRDDWLVTASEHHPDFNPRIVESRLSGALARLRG
jgi:hypothetical protein